MMMTHKITSEQINAVLQRVQSLSDDPNVQLSVLLFTLLVHCKNWEVDRDSLDEQIDSAEDAVTHINLVHPS